MTTRTRTISRSALEHILDHANIAFDQIRTDYSGRGMYGGKCFGVTMSNSDMPAFFAAIGWAIGYSEAADMDDLYMDLDRLIDDAQIDSMGLDVIVYFSRWTIAD